MVILRLYCMCRPSTPICQPKSASNSQHLAPGSVIQSTVAKSPQACSYWCSKTSLCCSFSYNANSMVCTVSYKCFGENECWLSSRADNTFVTYKESEYQNIYIRSLLQRDYLRSQIHPASTHVGLLSIKPHIGFLREFV